MTATYVAQDSTRLRAAGWALHAYTASGTAIAFLALAAAVGGKEVEALWWLFVALIIDGTDGMLARRLRVKEVIPAFDGARLDDIVDYITYCFVPVFLLWHGGHLPDGRLGTFLAVLPLLASSYQFCRTDAKTDDHFFLGFPSYWNVLAFYVIVLGVSPGATAALLLTCVVLVFVAIAVLAPFLAPYDPVATNFLLVRKPPSPQHLLGTDREGHEQQRRQTGMHHDGRRHGAADLPAIRLLMHRVGAQPAARHDRARGRRDRKSTRLNSSHVSESRMPSSA